MRMQLQDRVTIRKLEMQGPLLSEAAKRMQAPALLVR